MSLDRYLNLIIKNWKIIAGFMSAMLIVAILYGVFVYKPLYKSSSKILITSQDQTTFVVDLDAERQSAVGGKNANPSSTQIQILSSNEIAEEVAKKFQLVNTDYEQYPVSILGKVLKSSLEYETPPGTDVIKIILRWNKPDEAQKLAQLYLDAYIDYNVKSNRKSIAQAKSYIVNQLDESSKKLDDLKKQIEKYRKENESLNIDVETTSIISQVTAIENSIAKIGSEYESELTRKEELSKKLGFDVAKAIKSVAIGQNSNLLSLQTKLMDAQQKYASYKVKYPASNIKMSVLSEDIKEIKNQIEKQMQATIGEKFLNNDNSIISDPVRMKIVDELVSTQVNVEALKSQKASLVQTLNNLKEKQLSIPTKKRKLDSLLQEESLTVEIVKTLSAKLVEAKIRESEIVSGVEIIDNPEIPTSASFPTFFILLVMFEVVGFILGIATILGLYMVKDICQGTEDLEEILGVPVFGVIPWLTTTSYNNNKSGYNPSSAIGIAYQKIIASFKIKCYKNKSNVIGLSTAEFEKKRSFISTNLSKNLVKTNKSVVVIDADFRTGCLKNEFNIKNEAKYDLVELLIEISDCISNNKRYEIEKTIENALVKVEDNSNLFVITNNGNIENPYELLTTDAFSILIQYLKQKVDFVLIDTPPILSVPDAISISQYIDGLVILCGIKTSRSNLRKIQKLCSDNEVKIFGAIARDNLTELEIPESQYIKNLSIDERDCESEAIVE